MKFTSGWSIDWNNVLAENIELEKTYTKESQPIEAEDRVELQPADALETREESAEGFEEEALHFSAPIKISSAGAAVPPPPNGDSSAYDAAYLFKKAYGNIAFLRLSGLPVQAKLKIGQPGDIHEQEADRVAEQVMKTAGCQEQR